MPSSTRPHSSIPDQHIDNPWSERGKEKLQRCSLRSHNTHQLLQALPIRSAERDFSTMADQNVLSDLCSIWYVWLAARSTSSYMSLSNLNISHINVPQYRCPRCSCQTCSAQCVKRHKEWHQCSGKRDPTAKVPKAQLFTPAGIDHDFNFITGIERSRADLETKVPQGKRIEGGSLRSGIESKSRNIQERLDLTRVNIDWAPIGMSRQKLNQTKWSKVTS